MIDASANFPFSLVLQRLMSSPLRGKVHMATVPILPNNEDMMNELVLAKKGRGLAKAEGAGPGQCFLPDHAPRLQSGARRVLRLVRPGAAIRVQQGDGQRLARRARGPRARLD